MRTKSRYKCTEACDIEINANAPRRATSEDPPANLPKGIMHKFFHMRTIPRRQHIHFHDLVNAALSKHYSL